MKLLSAILVSVALTLSFPHIALADCGQCAQKAPHSHKKHCEKQCKDAKNKKACQKKCIAKHDAKKKK